MNYYPFHIGDYASATQHLTEFEDLAYRRLMDVYYVSEKPIPLDRRQAYRLVRASSDAMREAVDTIINEFFTPEDDGWHHKRCDAEIDRAREKSNKAKANGKQGGLAKAKRTLEPNLADATPDPSKGLATNTNTNPNPKIEDGGGDARDAFEQLDAALRQIPGIADHPVAVAASIASIWQLVQSGYDLHTQIIPSVRRQLQKAKDPIGHWQFFVNGIIRDATKAAEIATVIPINGAQPHEARSRKPTRADFFAETRKRLDEAEHSADQGSHEHDGSPIEGQTGQ
jgi:uncharacterized protein YdaU (DUF1376 family)